jgi:hypothetical protein
MSNHRWCCCGEGSPCSAFCCASSYVVNPFTVTYLYEQIANVLPVPCINCRLTNHTLQLTATKSGPFVVSRTNLGGSDCCYRGYGTVTITGSLDIEELWDPSGLPCPPPNDVPRVLTHNYTFMHEVCACITVRCVGNLIHCDGVEKLALQHTLEIGDFTIWCSHESMGDGDCDSCPTMGPGPVQLRSVGARLAFSSSVNCLPAVTNRECLGWWPPTDQWCGDGEAFGSCYVNLENNLLPIGSYMGPFGIVEQLECSDGRDDFACVDDLFPSNTVFQHALPLIPYLDVQLKSPCATMDDSYTLPCGQTVSVRQQGGCPQFWTYS